MMKIEVEDPRSINKNQSEYPDVTIVVLNWNGYKETSNCLSSISNIQYPRYNVVVIDNGSDDGSGKKLEQDYPWCDYIFNDKNEGFSSACNDGIKYAYNEDSKFVLLLNNDVEADEYFLNHLICTAENNPSAGLVGPKILRPESTTVEDAGRKFNKLTLSFNNPHKGKDQDSLKGEHNTDGISGCCMLIRTELISDIGFLDETHFFFGGEDVDYCERVKSSGRNIIVNANAEIYHSVSATADNHPEFLKYHYTRNKLVLSSKIGGSAYIGVISQAIYDSMRILYYMMTSRSTEAESIFAAYKDFIQKKYPDKKNLL